MSIIGKKLGNAKKRDGQILEHNRLRPIAKFTCVHISTY